jgi:hypothetical protein
MRNRIIHLNAQLIHSYTHTLHLKFNRAITSWIAPC